MKKLYLILSFLIINSISFSQTTTFTNDGGDKLWSNPSNWTAGIPNSSNSKITLKNSVILDVNAEIGQIKLAGGFGSVSVTSGNNSILTITGQGVTQPIQNNSSNEDLNLNLKVVLSSSDVIETFQASAAGTCSITFGSSSDLTLNVATKFMAQNSRSINMNGIMRGNGQFRVGAASKINFGSTSENSSFTGGFKMLGNNSELTSNTSENGTFLPENVLIEPDASSTGHSITINGENTLKGNIKTTTNTLSLNINKNQSSAGLIFLGSGNLNLTMIAAVTNLAFADNSSSTWGNGELVVTGFQNNVISFGTNASGLTSEQLSKINVGGTTIIINSSGEISTEVIVVTQSTFNNAGGDKLWSNIINWSNGIPNVSTAKVTLNDSLILDVNAEIGQIKLVGGFGNASVSSNNNSTLTITGEGVTAPIQNNGLNVDLNLNLKIILSSLDDIENFQVNGGGTSSIAFGENSDLTINVPTKLLAQGNKTIDMNGVIRGLGQFQIAGNSKVIFGNTSNNSNFNGVLEFFGSGASITANTSSGNSFLDNSKKLLVSNTGASLKLNESNILNGNIEIGDNNLSIDVIANQDSIGTITIGNDTLKINIDTAVTQLSFTDNSLSNWGSGTITIIGFQDNLIRFGTNENGLTSNQLEQINIGLGSVKINNLGYLFGDDDSDGVINTEDQCSDTPTGETVDQNGCSNSQKDTDGDGVNDDKDECPDTISGENVDVKGCPLPLFIESVTFIKNIYPNPAKNYINLILKNKSKIKDIYFIDFNGKLLNPKSINQLNGIININISNLKDGIYLLSIHSEKEVNKIKVIIEK